MASPDGIPSVAPSIAAEVADAIHFRDEFGLRSDVGYILAVADDPAANLDYGVPLLPSEVAELQRRDAQTQRAVPILEAYGAEHADEYGGLYQDQDRGGILVMLFTRNLDQHSRAVWDQLWSSAPGTPVRFQLVAHTEAELLEVQANVAGDTAEWETDGIDLVAVLVDIPNNVVEIDVLNPPSDAEERLRERYGADVIRVVSTDQPPGF